METINDKEKLFCDVVMKGGITSGIVYPRAIFELAKAYTFKNVGGTSAGAIAASLAAAAEYRRRTDKTTAGFDELNNIPTQLSNGALQKLFQPQVHTWSLYKFALAFIGSSHCVRKALNVAVKLFAFPATWVGALFGAAALTYLYFHMALRPWWVWLFLGLSFVSLILFLAVLNIVVQALWAIPANLYGLCLGSGGKSKDKPLTDWLADRLKLIAKKDLLTFNDLWSAGLTDPPVDGERVVNLEMMTTNLTFGRPYRIPFTDDETHLFYFRESEFRKLFPKEVVDYMKAAKPHERCDKEEWAKLGADYHPFPTGKDLPILVATRMSLSFPILISAVPLYTFDSTSKQINRCLFSDGGISSNFPIHFFDAPVPTWPTFGITLSSSIVADNGKDDESEMVSLCGCNNPGDEENWNHFDDHCWRLAGFAGAIVTTMEDWRDQTQARVPGYRDRIATIRLRHEEGGLNLKMPSDVVTALSKRGALAGTRLRQRFNPAEGDGSGLNWENQRWIRYRSFMGVFAAMLANFKRNYEFKQACGVRSYDEMVRNGGIGDSSGHCRPDDTSRFTAAQTSDAQPKTEELRNLWSAAPAPAETFVEGAPQPAADFVIRPKV